jgi:uncharacterized membrane protein
MSNQRSTSHDEDLLLQDFSRNVTTKSWALFSGNAAVVSAIPLCKFFKKKSFYLINSSVFQGSFGVFIKWIFHHISSISSLVLSLVHIFSI